MKTIEEIKKEKLINVLADCLCTFSEVCVGKCEDCCADHTPITLGRLADNLIKRGVDIRINEI